MQTRSHGCFWLLGGGVKACCRADFGCVDLVEKFRSLEVEKDLIIILSAETSLRLMSACSPRPLWESGFADGAGETAKTATPRIANGLSRQELCSEGETPRAWSKSKTGKNFKLSWGETNSGEGSNHSREVLS